jgi:hypothetical protein
LCIATLTKGESAISAVYGDHAEGLDEIAGGTAGAGDVTSSRPEKTRFSAKIRLNPMPRMI